MDYSGSGAGNCKTVWEVVDYLIQSLDEKDLEDVRKMDEQDLSLLHFGLGQYVRELSGLWRGNKELLADCGSEGMHADDASAVIIRALWWRLQTKH